MSYILPNGARISPVNVKGFEDIARCLREKTPIVVTVREIDGTEHEETLWHPDDPIVPFEIPKSYVPPPGPLKRGWRRIKAWISSSNA
jgi:hypothetical protein